MLLETGQKYMGLDVGKKTIGIAIGDPGHMIATPHRILWRRKFSADMADLFKEMDDLSVGGLIVGWPLNMDGSTGPRCDSTRDFCHALMRLRDVPIILHDERLSTAAVERAMLQADLTRKSRHQKRDALAAGWILQSAFDRMASGLDTLKTD
ncbi:MAG: Holliday junction resolvase RuvX [Candidatus Puniceispirillaceae bacterium]